MSKPRVLICVLSGRERNSWLNPLLFRSLLHLRDERFEATIEIAYDMVPYERARNSCVKAAQVGNYDCLVQIDNDMVLPGNFSDILHETIAARKAVVGLQAGAIDNTGDGFVMLACHDNGRIEGNFRRTGLVGGGVLIMSADVWHAIPKGPWFRWLVEGELSTRKMGEDYYFCELVQEHGLEVWTHKQPAGHLKTFDLTRVATMLTKVGHSQ